MQSICLLFSDRQGLADHDLNRAILRVPEVSRKIKELQSILDSLLSNHQSKDLYSLLSTGDAELETNSALQSLVASTIQIGLFQRYTRSRHRPQFLIGKMDDCSAMKVSAGLISFVDFVQHSQFVRDQSNLIEAFGRPAEPLHLETYGALQWNDNGYYEECVTSKKSAGGIIDEINQQVLLSQCIHVGPSSQKMERHLIDKGVQTLASVNSIDTDPILTSFWRAS